MKRLSSSKSWVQSKWTYTATITFPLQTYISTTLCLLPRSDWVVLPKYSQVVFPKASVYPERIQFKKSPLCQRHNEDLASVLFLSTNLTEVNFYEHEPLEMQILTQDIIILKCTTAYTFGNLIVYNKPW